MELRGHSIKSTAGKKKISTGKSATPNPPKVKSSIAKAPPKKKSNVLASKAAPSIRKSDTSKLTPLNKKDTAATISTEKVKRTVEEEAQRLLSLPPVEALGSTGPVTVKFNHYNKKFEVYNGVLRWSTIDEEYCLSFVYKGNFTRELHVVPANDASGSDSTINNGVYKPAVCKLDWPKAVRDELGFYFIGINVNREYELLVEEDPIAGVGAEGLTIRAGPLSAAALTEVGPGAEKGSATKCPLRTGNHAVKDLTKQLKQLNASELGSAEAKEMIERRDIEDVLFS